MYKKINPEFTDHWINELMSPETFQAQTFGEWISGFEERYDNETLQLMRYFYNVRREQRI